MHRFNKCICGLVVSIGLCQMQGVPQFLYTINQANLAFHSNDIPSATTLFIQGYWQFRNSFTQIWHDVDPYENQEWGVHGLNGNPIPLKFGRFTNPRGLVQMSNIWLGCWLNNSLLHQKVNWYHPSSKGLCNSIVFYKGKSKSNVIKKRLVETFGNKNEFKALKDVGNWLQKDFCVPVSQVLLQHFQNMPKNAHELLQILELYKCYIECDCGDTYQIRFAQANYNEVYNAFYPWFADVVKVQLSSPVDNDLHTALIAILFHCDEKMSNFTNTRAIPDEIIRGLGGYQIEIGTFLKHTIDPNFLNGVEIYEGKSSALFNELKNVQQKWKGMQEECQRGREEFVRMYSTPTYVYY